ncbi:hypothetical protein J2Y63_006827 [Shinella sp. BE166]|uniref:hypothetical protein n=1 Tax=Shinella sp. BE166 TaxID=3373918 RepID=UPI003EBFCC3D
MTTLVTSPRKPMSEVDEQIECEAALDEPVKEFVDSIIQAGWSPRASYAALRNVVEHQAHAYAEDSDPADDPVEGRKPMQFPLAPF